MDDITIFENSKKKLHAAIVEIRKFIGRRFRLKLKGNYQVCKFHLKMADVHLGEVAYIYALPDPSFYLLLSVVSAALRKAPAGKAVSGGHYDQ